MAGGWWKRDAGHRHLERKKKTTQSHNCLFLSLSVSVRFIIMFFSSHSLWLTDASFGSNELKLTRAEWVNYCTWLFLSRLCIYCTVPVCLYVWKILKVFLIILIKTPLVIIQSSFLSILLATLLIKCLVLLITCVTNWNGYKVNICLKGDPLFRFIGYFANVKFLAFSGVFLLCKNKWLHK